MILLVLFGSWLPLTLALSARLVIDAFTAETIAPAPPATEPLPTFPTIA